MNILEIESKLEFMYEAHLNAGEYELAAWYFKGLRTVQEQIGMAFADAVLTSQDAPLYNDYSGYVGDEWSR